MHAKELAAQYRNALLDDVIPFWEKHSRDAQYGGYFTCLDRQGQVFDTDKFIWLQAREVWTFSKLHNRVEQRSEWLDMAQQGADFLAKHGRNPDGDWYFSLTRAGQPLIQAYNIFSDCFAAMAFGQLALATGDSQSREIALDAFNNVLRRQNAPKGIYNKAVPGTRPLRALGLPMIMANLVLELEDLLEADVVEGYVQDCIDQVMGTFLDPDRGLVYENVFKDGAHSDSFEGRLINPGHGIEAMWFMMDLAQRQGDVALTRKALDMVLSILDFGWDQEFGGLYYFLDAEGHPPQQLEWDQKLWWVHGEALVALAMGWQLTGDARCRAWYEKVHEYTFSHFPDPEYGEWYGYLNRRGEVLLPLKGGKWKGCFHVPRTLHRCGEIFSRIAEKE